MSLQGFDPGSRRMAVTEDCQATALTTQPPRLGAGTIVTDTFRMRNNL